MASQTSSKSSGSILLAAIAVFMLALSYASVPLYKMFCQKTGYGGTPKINLLPTQGQRIGEKLIIIRFNTDVDPKLPWEFTPMQSEMTIRTGAEGIAYFKVRNKTNEPIDGMATYNVTPEKAGGYFNKIKCFCFDRQRLEPNEEVEMPVLFFIDPDFETDLKVSNIKTLTLSYTFFRLPS